MPKQIVFAAMTFLHDLATAIWIGGLITLGLTVLPTVRHTLGLGPQTRQLMDAIQRRLRVFIYISIVVLIVTGIVMSNRVAAYQGLFSFANAYSTTLSIKHVLVILMVVVALLRSVAVDRLRLEGPARERLSAALLMLNIVLGVLVLLASGYSAALSAGLPGAPQAP